MPCTIQITFRMLKHQAKVRLSFKEELSIGPTHRATASR